MASVRSFKTPDLDECLESYYPESFAQTSTNSENVHQLRPPCRSWGHFGTCEQEGHEIAHELICNREWCDESGCGGIDGAAHQRRKAKWYPKARQLQSIGRFVITLPPEVRGDYRTKAALGTLGKALKRPDCAGGIYLVKTIRILLIPARLPHIIPTWKSWWKLAIYRRGSWTL